MDTLESVSNQNYNKIQHIIKDGGSVDGTIELISKYKSSQFEIISSPDTGIYDALNQGLMAATGDIIGFLHSDDMYYYEEVIATVVDGFKSSGADCIYGDLVYVNRSNTDQIRRYWRSRPYREGLFNWGWMPPHPSFFVKRKIYEKHGGFRTEFRSAGDYEIMLRFLHCHQISSCYIPKILIKMRIGGYSNITFANRLKANNEDFLAWKVNGLKPKIYTRFLKPILKLPQWMRSAKPRQIQGS